MAWIIYYDSGETFSSEQGHPGEAPSEGFICAVGWDESGDRYIMHGWDFYCWDVESDQWWGMDNCGLHDRLRRNKVFAYKEGRTVTKASYNETMQRAHEENK